MISVGRIKTYTKALGLSLLVGLSSCDRGANKVVENVVKTDTMATTKKILSLLERGDRHSAVFTGVPKDINVIKAKDAKQYCESDSGEIFYRVYVGQADKAIRKAKKKKGDLVTVGQGITGLNCIKLANGVKVYEGDYISSRVADSLLTESIHEKDSILSDTMSNSRADLRLVENPTANAGRRNTLASAEKSTPAAPNIPSCRKPALPEKNMITNAIIVVPATTLMGLASDDAVCCASASEHFCLESSL